MSVPAQSSVMSIMIRASFIDDTDSYGSRALGDTTRITQEGTPIDGKPTVLVKEQEQPEPDGQARFMGDSQESEQSPSQEEGSRVPLSADSTPDKQFMQTPWVKPPRRESFNESATRGWRRDYQAEYREEHGNNS